MNLVNEEVNKAIRDHQAKLANQRKEKAIEILKDIENTPANWEDNIEDNHWDSLSEEPTLILDSFPKEEEINLYELLKHTQPGGVSYQEFIDWYQDEQTRQYV